MSPLRPAETIQAGDDGHVTLPHEAGGGCGIGAGSYGTTFLVWWSGLPRWWNTLATRYFCGTSVFMSSQSLVPKKKRGPAATGKGTQLQVRVHDPMLAALDAWVDAQPDPKPSRPEAIRALLREGLAEKGLLKATDDPTAIAARIEVLEAKVASTPQHSEPSPETGMNTMKRALAEAKVLGLRRRKRVSKGRPQLT